MKVLGKVRHWWRNGEQPPPVPFEIACACGQVVRGFRQPTSQVVSCPGCRKPLFVLPLSPLPPVAEEPGGKRIAPPAMDGTSLRRRVVTAGGVLLLTAAAVFLVVYLLSQVTDAPKTPVAAPGDAMQQAIAAGREALAAGNYHLACADLDRAAVLLARHPQTLAPSERRKLKHLNRQAHLLADGLTESLQEVLHDAAGLDAREWEAVFARRYRGRSVIYDGRFRRDGAGAIQLVDYQLMVGREEVRLEWGDVDLLRRLPLTEAQRVIVGVRLASCRREAEGRWVVRFQPDSGVLLTDLGAVMAACWQPLDDELKDVIARQEGWVAGEP